MRKIGAVVAVLGVMLVFGSVMAMDARTVVPRDVSVPVDEPEPSGVVQEAIAPTLEPQVTVIPLVSVVEEANPALVVLRDRPGEPEPAGVAPTVELPIRLRIPSIRIDADVEYVGLTKDGAMDVPTEPLNVAWYQLGPKPGERGNAVFAGHVDWGQRAAIFWSLKDLAPGDVVEVVAADGKQYDFTVEWAQWYEADSAPVEEVFGQGDASEITLITCGGRFDPRTRQYLSRLVVRGLLRG